HECVLATRVDRIMPAPSIEQIQKYLKVSHASYDTRSRKELLKRLRLQSRQNLHRNAGQLQPAPTASRGIDQRRQQTYKLPPSFISPGSESSSLIACDEHAGHIPCVKCASVRSLTYSSTVCQKFWSSRIFLHQAQIGMSPRSVLISANAF